MVTKSQEGKINHFYYRGIHRTIPCNDLSLPSKRSAAEPSPHLFLKPKLQTDTQTNRQKRQTEKQTNDLSLPSKRSAAKSSWAHLCLKPKLQTDKQKNRQTDKQKKTDKQTNDLSLPAKRSAAEPSPPHNPCLKPKLQPCIPLIFAPMKFSCF